MIKASLRLARWTSALLIAVGLGASAQVAAPQQPGDTKPILLPGLPANVSIPTPAQAPSPATPAAAAATSANIKLPGPNGTTAVVTPSAPTPRAQTSATQSGSGGTLFSSARTTGAAPARTSPPMPTSATPIQRPVDAQMIDARPAQLSQPPAIDPTIPLTPLPGLGTPPVTRDGRQPLPREGKPIIVRSQEGVTDFVYVSANFPNRIATPFSAPKIIDQTDTKFLTSGNSIYVTPRDSKPIAIFIVSADNPTRSVALTLVPQQIPQQNILVMLEGSGGAASPPATLSLSRVAPPDIPATDPYEAQLAALLRAVVRDSPPSGYAQEQLYLPASRMGPLRIDPQRRYSGSRFDVWTYRITNLSSESIEMQEPWFYVRGVKAVAYADKVLVGPGQETQVFVVSAQEAEE